MEEDDESKNLSEPFPQQLHGSTMEDKPFETLDATNTEQCEFPPESESESVPELGDSQLSSIEAKDGDTAAEVDESPLVVAKSPPIAAGGGEDVADFLSAGTGGEEEVEAGRAGGGVESSVSVLDDSQLGGDTDLQLVGDETPNVAKDDEVVAAEEIPSGLGFHDLVLVGKPSNVEKDDEVAITDEIPCGFGLDGMQPVAAKKGEAAVAEGEVSTADGEMKCEVEGLEGNESELVGDTLSIADEVVVDEITRAGTEPELENVETEFVPELESSVGRFVSEFDDSQMLRAESVPAKEDKDVEKEMEMEITEVTNEVGTASVAPLDNLHGVDAESQFVPALESGEGKFVSELDDSQMLCAESSIPAKEDEVVEMAAEMGTTEAAKLESTEVAKLESSEGNFVSEYEDSEMLGAESSIPAKEDEIVEMAVEMETTEVANEVGTASVPQLDSLHCVDAESPIVPRDDDDEDDERVAGEDGTPIVDTEIETETEVAEAGEADKEVGDGGGKRKRGRVTKVQSRATPKKKLVGEDVCFICFDGGDLVLCDRRLCTKAYHPSCVNRDEAFFQAKGRWNCGWHLCSICEKNATYMCYTCTFSLCKACIKDAVILCVKGNKGFCETCMKTVMLIENNEQAGKEDHVDFNDKSSWEYLFKDYWVDLKAKLSLSSAQLANAKNPWKGSYLSAGKQESPAEMFDANNDQGSGSESSENLEVSKHKRGTGKKRSKSLAKDEEVFDAIDDRGSGSESSEYPEAGKLKRRKVKKRSKSLTKKEDLPNEGTSIRTPVSRDSEWASKELLEFVMHMKNGEKSVLSQFDVQALLLEYIKRNKLRDPRKKSQIICDARLENLFGKARVGHFEMLKLLESHFLVKEDSQIDDVQGTVVDTEANQLEADGTLGSKDRRRKMRKRGDVRGPQSNLEDYAAIDMHNINLIYLRRKLVEDLLEDIGKFHDKVVDTFVRIRISGSNQKQDMYRLVQVVGTKKADEPYKVGKKTADLVLEILNLNKTEVVSIDTISNQEFTEDECKRLRQSIKLGLIKRLKVGDILEKAMEVQTARVNDWLETETVRLSHLRDRASDTGRRKELRECVEKLQLLKTPEERLRRLEEVPIINADPNMDPTYESEEDDIEMEDNKQEIFPRPRGSGFSRKGREPISPRRGNFSSPDSGSGTRRSSGKNWDMNRNNSSKDFSNKGEEATFLGEIPSPTDNSWNQVRDKEVNMEKVNPVTNSETVGRSSHSFVRSESFSGVALEPSRASLAAGVTETAATKINETEKMWHYKDPSGKVQGPFSLVQLRKWNNNKYFPADLRIWRTTETEDDSMLLTDALDGRFPKALRPMDNNFTKPQTVHSPHISSTHTGQPYGASLQPKREVEGGERVSFNQSHGIRSQLELSSSGGWGTHSVEVPKVSADGLGSHYSRNDSLNLPSPTPMSSTPRWAGGGQGSTHSPAVATLDNSGQLARSSSSINQSGSKDHTAMESLGVSAPLSVMRGSENDSLSSLPTPTPVPNSDQGIFVGSTTALPTSQTIVTGQSHGIQHLPVGHQQWGSGSVQTQEMAAPHQTVGSDSQAWGGGASSQNSELNPSLPVPVQPAAYGQWGPVPSTIQNPAGNFSAPPFSAFPQPDPWRQPVVAGNQPNIPPAAPPNVPWGMGVPQNNVNTVWGPMQGNPNMGWVGPQPGTTNMNWGPAVQGPVNPGWVAPTANPGAVVQGIPPGNANQGWAPQPGNPGSAIQGPIPGNGNPGWVAPTGNNPGFNVQGQVQGNVNPVWGTQTGNPGTTTVQGPAPGNANSGWGPQAGNSGTWGNENQNNGNRFSGQRDRGSFQGRDSGFRGGRGGNNNRQSSFGSGGQRVVCPYHRNGRCKKGASCDMLHT